MELEPDQVVTYKAKDASLHEEKIDYAIRNAEIDLKEAVRNVALTMQMPTFGTARNVAYDADDYVPLLERALEKDANLVLRMCSAHSNLQGLRMVKDEAKGANLPAKK